MHHPSGLIAFRELRHSNDWRRWADLAATAPPHLSPEFFALIEPLSLEGEAVVAEAWRSDRMTGVLPLVLAGTTLRAMRSDHSPGYDYCGSAEGIAAIWESLQDDDRWHELVLDKVPTRSLLVEQLPALVRRDGGRIVMSPDSRHPFFPLPGFDAAIDPKFRTNLQRCARKAGDLVLERIAVPTRADLDAATAIEAMAWKGIAGTAIAADPRAAHLYQALARVLGRRRQVSLYFLRAAGKRIATLFALEDGHTLYALKIGYDPAVANLSPGHLLIWKVAADAAQRGLAELDFVGREDEWKRKWTDRVHPTVKIVVYRGTLRGLARYAMREVVKPHLPETVRETPHSPLPRRCQRADVVGDHTLIARVRRRLARGLGIRSGLRRALRKRGRRAPLGEASRFPVGSWVRVLDAPQIEALVDDRKRTRGLPFVPTQWQACGNVYRVERHVRRIRDDHGRFRAVSRTVLLEGVDCGGDGPEPAGCGRHCPLMFRDEWLEPAPAVHTGPPGAAKVRHARVRDLAEIYAGLDAFGRRDGVTFMPEMAVFAGKRLPIAGELREVYEHDRWIPPAHPIFLLRGASCTGAICGKRGPCDRACALMWHADWLLLEDPR